MTQAEFSGLKAGDLVKVVKSGIVYGVSVVCPSTGRAYFYQQHNRVEVSGAEFPQLTAAQLEEKAVAILRYRYTVRAKLERPSRGVKQVPRPAQGDRASAAAAVRSESIRPSHSFN